MKRATALMTSLAITLSGCATIIDGKHQNIAIDSNPRGAECNLIRKGETIGTVTTPANITIDKTKDNITITCSKKGFQTNSYLDKSGNEGDVLGNIILSGGIGWAVDSAVGADNKYETPVNITLQRN